MEEADKLLNNQGVEFSAIGMEEWPGAEMVILSGGIVWGC